MPSLRTTRRAAALALLALAVAAGLSPHPAHAQGPAQPARKDSSPRTRPKEVTVTAAVTPATARPGDTVSYKVTATLKPGWHIYSYAREQQGDGPRNTRFDFFDTAGLKPEGEWSASKPATRKKEPAFPDIDAVEFYEGEVTWTQTLKVPADAAPGARVLRCQTSYQICDASRCSFPGQWTLPDVTLTVEGGAGAAQAAAPAAEAPKPKKKDTPPFLKPKSAVLKAAVEPAKAAPGQAVSLKVTAKLDPEWHIYNYAKEQPGNGPRVTQFDVFDSGGLTPTGDWTPDHAPELKQDPAFDNLPVEFFEGEVTWTLPLKVPANATPGPRPIRCQVGYQVCDAHSCSPPGQWTLPEVAFEVVATAAAAGAAAAAPPENVAAAPAPTETPKAESAPAPTAKAEPAPAPAPLAETTAEAKPKARAVSEVERTAQQGIIPLMVASALGGLLALVMPCVWPMVPITVNFFVKQGQTKDGKKASTTGLAVTYCLAIIGVFTAVGVLCSFFLSATALPRLANNPWLNFFVAGLFFAFGLSLLGLFEVRLPNALLNASARGESKGGLVGVMFMALTLTITSFTCTFPVVGGLLVMASTGQFFYPVVGLATFATVIALPFFLLALSPGLLSRMPRSGDWMNSVKVIGGLVEIGAAFKFLNTAELAFVTPDNAWFDAEFVLTAWVVLAAVCGIYLLGLFRTDHDHDEVRVGPGRLVLGCGFLGLALYLAPALFGRPPQSLVWERMVVGLLPPDVGRLSAVEAGPALIAGEGAKGGGSGEVHATDSDPKTAERQEKRFHGVWWGFSYEAALEKARAENRPVLIDFTGVNCANCRLMEQRVLPKPEVVEELKKFVTIQLYTLPSVPIHSLNADQRNELAEKNSERQIDLTNDNTNPFYVVLSPDGKVLGTTGGYREPEVFVNFLRSSLGKVEGTGKVAQAGTSGH